jgi:eukaryotic-like serine/threonine-protein kinase
MPDRVEIEPDEDETTVVRKGSTHRIVEEEEVAPAPPAPPPKPFTDPGPSYGDPVAAREEERLTVGPDGQVEHERERVERRPMRGPFDDFWPALAILLLAALIGLGALWYFTRSDEKAVPSVTSQPLDTAVSRLQDEGFKTDIVNRANAAPRGTVFEQRPSAGTELEEGDTVTILASTGPATVVVPNAVGLPEQQARDRLASASLEVRVFEVFSDKPEGTVIAQNPGSGERVSPDESVRLNVSKGSGLVDVPSVVGLTRAEADAQLSDAGLEANVFEVPSIEPAGTVVAQHPVGGRLRQGQAVRLNVSTGTPQ